jgi:SAM-dependent methyltransferase
MSIAETATVPRCPACGGAATAIVRAGAFGPCGLARCATCGTEHLRPQPSDDRLRTIYGPAYYEPWAVEDAHVVDSIKRMTFSPMLDACEIEPGSAVLDLGCATGSFLAEAAARGARAYGIDLNPEAIADASARVPDAEFHVGYAADCPFPDVSFDAVVMIDFIEHVRDPRQELEVVRKRMHADSRLVVSTPRADSLLHRVMGRHWPQYREEHLTYFSRTGLTQLLEACGFCVAHVGATRKVLTLSYAYGQAVAYPVPVLSELTRLGYRLAPGLRQKPLRISLGEMTVVAHTA